MHLVRGYILECSTIYIIRLFSGVPKPASADQPVLIKIVVGVVRKMISAFNSGDIVYVRSLRNSKAGVLNVECRSVAVATAVKSTFANLVKSANPPAYLKNVSKHVFSFDIQINNILLFLGVQAYFILPNIFVLSPLV